MPFRETLHSLDAAARRVRAGLLQRRPEDSFAVETLASAVASVLATRLSLELTGYPQLGNDTLHIAHVLWGGLLMLVAGRLSLASYGSGIRRLSAAVLGVGFGLFVDEIGKFITRDHDYFFRPAAALIYISFVLLYLAAGGVRLFLPVGDRALLCVAIESRYPSAQAQAHHAAGAWARLPNERARRRRSRV